MFCSKRLLCYPETTLHPESDLHSLVHSILLVMFGSSSSCKVVVRCSATHSLELWWTFPQHIRFCTYRTSIRFCHWFVVCWFAQGRVFPSQNYATQNKSTPLIVDTSTHKTFSTDNKTPSATFKYNLLSSLLIISTAGTCSGSISRLGITEERNDKRQVSLSSTWMLKTSLSMREAAKNNKFSTLRSL